MPQKGNAPNPRLQPRQILLRLLVVGLQAERKGIVSDGLVQPSLPFQGNAEAVVRFGILGLEFGRLAQMIRGLG